MIYCILFLEIFLRSKVVSLYAEKPSHESKSVDQYQGAIVVFNYTDKHVKVVLVSRIPSKTVLLNGGQVAPLGRN